jgi:hypothetical protein
VLHILVDEMRRAQRERERRNEVEQATEHEQLERVGADKANV